MSEKRENVCLYLCSFTDIFAKIYTGCESKIKKIPLGKVDKKPVFTKKENATLRQRIQILDWHHQSGEKNQTKTAEYWNKIYPNLCLKQPVISAWLKNEAKWQEQWAEIERGTAIPDAKRARQTEHPEVTEMLELWVAKAKAQNVLLTGEVLRKKWRQFADFRNVPEDNRLTLSDGWLASFKKRCGLQEFRRHGEAGSANPTDVENERKRVQEIIATGKYNMEDIFNMDEMGLFYACVFCASPCAESRSLRQSRLTT